MPPRTARALRAASSLSPNHPVAQGQEPHAVQLRRGIVKQVSSASTCASCNILPIACAIMESHMYTQPQRQGERRSGGLCGSRRSGDCAPTPAGPPHVSDPPAPVPARRGPPGGPQGRVIYGQRVAVDEDGRVLVWTGDAGSASVTASAPAGTAAWTPLLHPLRRPTSPRRF